MHDNALMIRICLFFTIVSSSILGDFNGWIFPLPSLHLTHPYKAVGQIIMLDDQGMSHSCSGVLISSQDVLTAAHCIIMPGTSTPYSSISFHPARFVRSVDRVAVDPQGSSLATDYWVFRSFLKAQEMGSNVKVDVHEFDIALFRLKDRLGDRMGWIDLFDAAAESILESQAFSSWTATLVGYPSSLLGAGVMATCRANESGLYDPLAAHSCQTAAGLSGSPLLSYQQDRGGMLVPFVRAVHTMVWEEGSKVVGGSAITLTPYTASWIQAWLADERSHNSGDLERDRALHITD